MADTTATPTSPKYVQVDSNNYVSTVKNVLADSDDATQWIKLFIPSQFQTDFGKFFDKYQVDADTKALIPRPGADNPSIDTVQQALKDTNAELVTVKQANSDLTDQLSKVNTSVQVLPQVQQMVMQSTQSQAQTTATLKQLQQVAVQLTQQLAVMQKPATDTASTTPASETATSTDTTK